MHHFEDKIISFHNKTAETDLVHHTSMYRKSRKIMFLARIAYNTWPKAGKICNYGNVMVFVQIFQRSKIPYAMLGLIEYLQLHL